MNISLEKILEINYRVMLKINTIQGETGYYGNPGTQREGKRAQAAANYGGRQKGVF
jgi:hypothetical protein